MPSGRRGIGDAIVPPTVCGCALLANGDVSVVAVETTNEPAGGRHVHRGVDWQRDACALRENGHWFEVRIRALLSEHLARYHARESMFDPRAHGE